VPFILILPRWFYPNGVVRQVEASQGTGVVGEMAIEASRLEEAKPLLDTPQTMAAGIAMWVAVVLPLVGLAVAIPVGWGWGLSLLDLSMAVIAYVVTGLAITVGYHRGFTHRSFKARRGLRIALAVAGSLAVEGSPVQWVANHRRHHAFSDREGDPHSPWRYGTNTRALLKGMIYAHVGWMLRRELSNRARFAPISRPTVICGPSRGSPGCWWPCRCSCPRLSAGWSQGPGPARWRDSSGPGWSGWRSCTTSPGR
jgi:hypothetical protein